MKTLYRLSAEQLLKRCEVLRTFIPCLPKSIHKALFTAAVSNVPMTIDVDQPHQSSLGDQDCGNAIKDSLILLVSTWPTDCLVLQDFIQVTHIGHPVLMDAVSQGLLQLSEESPLKNVDARNFRGHSFFRLPLLSLSAEERMSDQTLQLVQDRCKLFFKEERDDTWEFVISWKLQEVLEQPARDRYPHQVVITLDCEIILSSDWLAIADELIALALQKASPFVIVVHKVTVDNYHMNQLSRLRGLLDIIDTKSLSKFVVYGKRRAVDLLMWHLSDDLKKLTNVELFGLGTSGPKMHLPGTNDPDKSTICKSAAVFLNQWQALREIYFIGIELTGQIPTLLINLRTPLQDLTLHSCCINDIDLLYLRDSHHITNLRLLGLEYNRLSGYGPLLYDTLLKACNLEILNIRETYLNCNDKVAVLCASQGLGKLHTLVLYENDAMMTIESYRVLIELACRIPVLKEFFLFPFNYQALEKFYRSQIDEILLEMKDKYDRSKLSFFY